jgi:hypothetical protein
MSISDALRTRIRQAANEQCGYCCITSHLVYAPMEIDHIFPKSRGGRDEEENLWLACPFCNNAKSDQISGTDPLTQETTPLFHPRKQNWTEHFTWRVEDRALIVGLTSCGRASITALGINDLIPLQFRRLMVEAGWYPPPD